MDSTLEQSNHMSLYNNIETDSEGSKEMIDEDTVLLGFLDSIEDTAKQVVVGHLLTSKVGGHPTWLVSNNIVDSFTGSSSSLICEFCNSPLQFLMQLDTNDVFQKETTFHVYGTMFVFMCPKMRCLQQDQHEQSKQWDSEKHACRSIKVLRNQLPAPTNSTPISLESLWPEMKLFFYKSISICEEMENEDVNEVSSLVLGRERMQELLEDNSQYSEEEFTASDMEEIEEEPLSDEEETWTNFTKTIEKAQVQVLRIAGSPKARPLWLSTKGQPNDTHIPLCPRCSKRRVFQFQIMPQLLSFLDLDTGPDSLDQGCHIGRLSGKSRPKDVVRTRSNVPASGRTSESADRRRTARADGQLVGLADGTWTSGRPVGRTSGWTAIGRHGGRPSDRQSPAPTVGWMADGRSIRWSGWRSAGRQTAGRTAWRTPPPGPSARGRPPRAVRQKPSARVRPPSQNFGGP
jgi:pre-rRNA-processing protein TSR4